MKTNIQHRAGVLLKAAVVLLLFSPSAMAGYLTPVILFVNQLIITFEYLGNSIAILMFLYGAGRYVYVSDDPAQRKQAIGICIASIVALIIIQLARPVITSIGLSAFPIPPSP